MRDDDVGESWGCEANRSFWEVELGACLGALQVLSWRRAATFRDPDVT